MRRVHPLWRGFYLAAAMTAALLLTGGVDGMAAYRFDRRMLALAAAVTVGAFLAALPGRLRKGQKPVHISGKRCLAAFLGGVGLSLGTVLAGSGRILPALMEGSVGAYAFVGAAWLTALLTVRIAGRRLRS